MWVRDIIKINNPCPQCFLFDGRDNMLTQILGYKYCVVLVIEKYNFC